MKLKYAILTASFIGMAAANAATIAWTAGTAVTAVTDISTTGDFVLGHNYGALSGAGNTNAGGATATVNGVTFTQSAVTTSVATINGTQQNNSLYTASTDTGLNTLLDSNVYGATALATISITGLTANTQYLIQVLGGDERPTNRIANVANSDGSGSVSGPANTGTSFIGTFTTGAMETSVEFQAFGTNFDQSASIAALQIRDVSAVPEPSSTALLGLGGLALILRRRK